MTRFEEFRRGALAFARYSWREGVWVHIIALVAILILAGAWALVWLAWQHLARFVGVLAVVVLLGAGCATAPPVPCYCTCAPPPDLRPPVVRDVEGDFRDELDRRQAGKDQRASAKKRFLENDPPKPAKTVRGKGRP